jgi:hypothetical protein
MVVVNMPRKKFSKEEKARLHGCNRVLKENIFKADELGLEASKAVSLITLLAVYYNLSPNDPQLFGVVLWRAAEDGFISIPNLGGRPTGIISSDESEARRKRKSRAKAAKVANWEKELARRWQRQDGLSVLAKRLNELWDHALSSKQQA